MKWAWHLSNPTKATQLLSSKSQRKKYTLFHETMKILKKKFIYAIFQKVCVGTLTVSMLNDSSLINHCACCFCPNFFLSYFHGPQLIDRVPNELKNQDFLLHLKPWKSSKTCRTFGTYTKLQPGLKLSKLFSWGRNNHFGVVMILIIFCLFPLAQIGYDPHCPKLPKLPAHPQKAHTSPILKTPDPMKYFF